MNNDWRDYELAHHGILGMKWGKLNGPPYPLGSGDHSSSEKKAGWRKSLGGRNEELYGRSDRKKEKRGLSDKQKKAIKIGLTAAGVALAAYGGYKLYQSGALDGLIKNGNAVFDNVNGKKSDKVIDFASNQKAVNVQRLSNEIPERIKAISEKTGLKLKETATTVAEDTKMANPTEYDRTKPEWKNNCSHACMSYVLRRLGLDIQAKPMSSFEEGGLMFSELGHYFKGINTDHIAVPKLSNGKDVKAYVANEIIKNCQGSEPGACGIFKITYSSGPKEGHGHFMAWENVNGIIQFLDPQVHSDNADSYFENIVSGAINNTIQAARFDNLEIRVNNLSEIVQNRN